MVVIPRGWKEMLGMLEGAEKLMAGLTCKSRGFALHCFTVVQSSVFTEHLS
jgi:hypothetical protein